MIVKLFSHKNSTLIQLMLVLLCSKVYLFGYKKNAFLSFKILLTLGELQTVTQRCSAKKVFLEISQNSQGNTCVIVSCASVHLCLSLRPATLLKERLWHKCFPSVFRKRPHNNVIGKLFWRLTVTLKQAFY